MTVERVLAIAAALRGGPYSARVHAGWLVVQAERSKLRLATLIDVTGGLAYELEAIDALTILERAVVDELEREGECPDSK